GHDERVWCVAWRPNKTPLQLASCGSDKTVRIWGLRASASSASEEGAWILLAELDASERHTRTLRSVGWDPAGETLAVVSFDATTSLWKEVSGGERSTEGGLTFECVNVLAGHENEV
ncbi:unnamed protein product, partial [Polarella glacialis]